MLKIVNENETLYYPMLNKGDEPSDEDFVIVLSGFIMIGNNIVDEDDLPKIIDTLELVMQEL